ncbi:MAG: hypothetical protein CME70_20605 [Halobacteriovorax sp.]|nr:hypothetical protein [Halobacteriovorax sp.]|tara:strand:+ start:7958 stop:9070 length:1113 start_codon:yes stop_codon:yes gene_type:complete
MVLRGFKHFLKNMLLLVGMILLTLFISQNVSAAGSDNRIFSQAKKAYSDGNYESVISILRRRYDFRDSQTPYGALTLAAYSYEKLGKLRNAQHIYTFLIKRRFKSINNEIISAYKNQDGAEDLPEAPEKLYSYYFKRGDLLSKIYVRDGRYMSEKRKKLYKETATSYAEIVGESDYEPEDDGDAEEIITRMEAAEKKWEMETFKWGWFGSLHYLTWRDKLKITTPTGTSVDIRSTAEGWCLGGGLKYENSWWQWNINGCYAAMSATVGNDSNLVNYFQKDVPASAFFMGAGGFWKPNAMDAAIGLNIPLMYRSGDYTEPVGYQLDNTSTLSYGWLIEAQWNWGKLAYSLKFGKINKFSSSMLFIGGLYNF